MSYEVKLKDRIAQIDVISHNGNKLLVAIDGVEYALDFVQIGRGSYSILHINRSYNVELIPINGIKKYNVNTTKHSFEVEIIDAESKYLASRRESEDETDSVISSPIPGKVVKLYVSEGDQVEEGQTLVVISAMKMESEFKASGKGAVTAVNALEGDSVDARQDIIHIDYS